MRVVRGGRGTDHHLDFLHRCALLDRKPPSLNAGLVIPQPSRLAIGYDTVRISVLSDVGLSRTIRWRRNRNGLSGCMYANRDFSLFETRQPIVKHVKNFP